MPRMKILLSLGCLIGGGLMAGVPFAAADPPHWDKVNARVYQTHPSRPNLVRPPYPGRYRDYSLRYHYERTKVFFAGPYYHVYHGRYLGYLDRPYHLGYGPPRREWKRGERNF